MGLKGDKLSNEAALTTELFTEKMSQISGITSKKMFGGYGIFHDEKMFGLVNPKGEIYLKADDSIKKKFELVGSHSHGRMPYFSLPEDLLLDSEKLTKWVKESIEISK